MNPKEISVANEFVSKNHHRGNVSGNFGKQDLHVLNITMILCIVL